MRERILGRRERPAPKSDSNFSQTIAHSKLITQGVNISDHMLKYQLEDWKGLRKNISEAACHWGASSCQIANYFRLSIRSQRLNLKHKGHALDEKLCVRTNG